jgi:hypothetical protein
MAQQTDAVLFLGIPGGPGTARVEFHGQSGSNPASSPTDFGFVDLTTGGTNSAGNPITPIKLTVAGVRFANPS